MWKIAKNILMLALLTFCGTHSFALPTDETQKMDIIANSSLLNYKNGANVYEGDVKIDQGATHLTADRVTTQNNDKHKMEEAIAYGTQKPARYWTIPKEGDLEFNAFAKVIKFYPIKSIVILEGDVVVTQGNNSFHGPLIIYNIKDQTVSAPASNKGRATIIIEPKNLS
ncbi:MAG: lipopolysaccharide transport periplasmic protein LptA [Gammaproteobacteria bacterium]|nr:lipopolysaccharide transport periplasmic protein LptA [Gammaproteobacteria bacterium]